VVPEITDLGFAAANTESLREYFQELETHIELINNKLCLLHTLWNRDKKFIKLRRFVLFFFLQMLAVVSILHLELYRTSAAALRGE
jgi:hypothetical protein